jgi:WD40 repeat protein
LVFEQEKCHAMGINDMAFMPNEWEIATCSSDRTVKIWKLDLEAKSFTEIRTLNLSEDDTSAYKDNVEKQILAVAGFKSGETLGLNLHSDISVWKGESTSPDQVIRGHRSTVNSVGNFNNTALISGDSEGHILSWDPATGNANRSQTQFVSKLGISTIAANS